MSTSNPRRPPSLPRTSRIAALTVVWLFAAGSTAQPGDVVVEGADAIRRLVGQIEESEARGEAARLRQLYRQLASEHGRELIGGTGCAPIPAMEWLRRRVAAWPAARLAEIEALEGAEAAARVERCRAGLASGALDSAGYEGCLQDCACLHMATRAACEALSELASRALDRGDLARAFRLAHAAWQHPSGRDSAECALQLGTIAIVAAMPTALADLQTNLAARDIPLALERRGEVGAILTGMAAATGRSPQAALAGGLDGRVAAPPVGVSISALEPVWELDFASARTKQPRGAGTFLVEVETAPPPEPLELPQLSRAGNRVWVTTVREVLDVKLSSGETCSPESAGRLEQRVFVRAAAGRSGNSAVSYDAVCIDANSGATLWRFSDPGLSIEGNLIAGGGDVLMPAVSREGGLEAHLIALDAATGTERWRVFLTVGENIGAGYNRWQGGEPPPMPLLTVSGGDVFVDTSRGMVAALNARDGSWLWAHPHGSRSVSASSGMGISVPILADGAVVCMPADGAALFALAATDGTTRWQKDRDRYRSLLGVQSGLVYVDGPECAAFDLHSGKLVEHLILPKGRHCGRGLLTQDALLVSSTDALYAVDLRDFRVREEWRWPIPGEAHSLLLAREDRLLSLGGGSLRAFARPGGR